MHEQEEQELREIEAALDPEIVAAMDAALAQVEVEQQQAQSASPGAILARYIRDLSAQERVVAFSAVTLCPPEGLTREQVRELLANSATDDAMLSIALVKGSKDVYYYDSGLMTQRFATVQSLIEDKDILATVAAAARHDCKVYPRPLRVQVLLGGPYFYSEDEVLGALARMNGREEYADIATVAASNGKLCIYSTTFMSKKYAQALCEEMEVTWQMNQ